MIRRWLCIQATEPFEVTLPSRAIAAGFYILHGCGFSHA
jgi:hypothetical protein